MTTSRRLTSIEYMTAWHAVEGAAGEPGADPATVLGAVLGALRISPPDTAAGATPGPDNGGAA